MNCDEPYKQIGTLNRFELKALIKECIREILAEEKNFSGVEYKALWLKAPPIETETMPPQCEKQTNTATVPWPCFELPPNFYNH